MVPSNGPTLVVSAKPCQSAQTSKTSAHVQIKNFKFFFILNFQGAQYWFI